MSPSYDITTNAIEQIHQNHTNFFPTVQVRPTGASLPLGW